MQPRVFRGMYTLLPPSGALTISPFAVTRTPGDHILFSCHNAPSQPFSSISIHDRCLVACGLSQFHDSVSLRGVDPGRVPHLGFTDISQIVSLDPHRASRSASPALLLLWPKHHCESTLLAVFFPRKVNNTPRNATSAVSLVYHVCRLFF